MPPAIQFQPAQPRFEGPYFGGPGGFQNVVIPCKSLTAGAVISLLPPNGFQWFRNYYDQLVVGVVADAAPTGPIFASLSDLGELPVYLGDVQAPDTAIHLGDYYQLSYDAGLGVAGGFHLLNWSLGLPSPLLLTTVGSGGPATYDGLTLNIPIYGSGSGGTQQIITGAGAVVATATDVLIALNKGAQSDTAISLPAVASRTPDANGNGIPIQIVDFSGNGGAITVTPAAGESIMGAATAVLNSGGEGVGLAAAIVFTPSVDLSGWLQSA